MDNTAALGDNGLPVVDSDITVEGGTHVIEREADARPFRVFAVHEDGTLTLRDVKLRNGQASVGGGILNRGTLTLTNSTVSDNYAGSGGGISSGLPLPASPLLTVTNSTVSNNSATLGGGIDFNGGMLVLTNSTVSGNSAEKGGAVYVFNYALDPVTLTHSTVSGNSTAVDWSEAIYAPGGNETTLNGSIVAGNAGRNCSLFVSGDDNFANDDTCGPGFAPITPGVDFDSSLADNGGPTQTHALLEGSVAIDAAGDCGLATDQRGEPRDDGACDSSSYEYQETDDVPATTVVGLTLLVLAVLGTGFYFLRRRATG